MNGEVNSARTPTSKATNALESIPCVDGIDCCRFILGHVGPIDHDPTIHHTSNWFRLFVIISVGVD